MGTFTKKILDEQKISRINQEGYSNQGFLMKIIEYINSKDIIVEFQDEYKDRVHTNYPAFLKGSVRNPSEGKYRIGEERLNTQGCLMRIVEYNNAADIIVEFQDEYKIRTRTSYYTFSHGNIFNPYCKSVFGVGMIGAKYHSRVNGKITKEYNAWKRMLTRCFYKKYKDKNQNYKDVTCCKEWLLYENFYEWLHSQPNFDKWLNGNLWAVDKDILVKGNKIYSPETCCLVPNNINSLFIKKDLFRGNFPIGVYKYKEKYRASCSNPFINNQEQLGDYDTVEQAFQTYKSYKEKIIKQVAQIEYESGNITKECYKAMINYEVEITD